ncbi:hypothetical protein CEXT_479841 [Caerostris extrusa]|uniref:Secreted protein n=1 Tax=Caerostris extrusa TaxID=172846 RepID=A0AAV4MQ77_CAEEX|nr:hypothetical protein CEXT_479841 [Caerostris extrusa]
MVVVELFINVATLYFAVMVRSGNHSPKYACIVNDVECHKEEGERIIYSRGFPFILVENPRTLFSINSGEAQRNNSHSTYSVHVPNVCNVLVNDIIRNRL